MIIDMRENFYLALQQCGKIYALELKRWCQFRDFPYIVTMKRRDFPHTVHTTQTQCRLTRVQAIKTLVN